MEWGLSSEQKECYHRGYGCLNPCSNGMGIELKKIEKDERNLIVLILVLMEWGLSNLDWLNAHHFD